MFALAHAFIASKVNQSRDPLLILGSVLPDYIWNDREIRYKKNIHYNPFEFFDYTTTNNIPLLSLAKGILLHSDISHGVDFYSDTPETGYAMQKGKQLVKQIMNSFLLYEDKAWDFSHNFIEAAIDLNIAHTNIDFLDTFKQSERCLDTLSIIESLSKFSSVSTEQTTDAVRLMRNFYYRNYFVSEKDIITNCLVPIAKNKFQTTDDELEVRLLKILNNAKIIIADSYEFFLQSTISSIISDPTLKKYN